MVTNTGFATWLAGGRSDGGVVLEPQLLSGGRDLFKGRPWIPLPRDLFPGETCRIGLKLRRPIGSARLRLELHLFGGGSMIHCGARCFRPRSLTPGARGDGGESSGIVSAPVSWILEVRRMLDESKRLPAAAGSGTQVVLVVPLYVEAAELWTLLREEPHETPPLSFPATPFEGDDPWPTVCATRQRRTRCRTVKGPPAGRTG